MIVPTRIILSACDTRASVTNRYKSFNRLGRKLKSERMRERISLRSALGCLITSDIFKAPPEKNFTSDCKIIYLDTRSINAYRTRKFYCGNDVIGGVSSVI